MPAMTDDALKGLIGTLGERVDAAAYGMEGWQAFLDGLTDAFPGSNVGFVHQTFRANPETYGAFSKFDPDFVASFAEHYGSINPFAPVMAALQPGQVVIANTFLPIRTYADTAFVAEWLEPQAATNSANVKLSGTPDSVAWISAHYDDERAADYDPAFDRVLQALRTRLTRAVATSDRLAASADTALRTAALLGRAREPAMILDGAGFVLDANRAAEEALEAGRALAVRGHRLVLRDAEAATWLAEALGSLPAAECRAEGAATQLVPGHDEAPYEHRLWTDDGPVLLHLAPLPAFVCQTWPISAAAGQRYLLLVQAQTMPDPGALFLKRCGVSPAEARLCRALADGMSLSEAAEALRITRNTARDRLKSIFRKTGVSRQSALILRMLSP